MPVDPVALPPGERVFEVTINGGLFGAFRDASPDYWGRLVAAAQAKAVPEALEELDYLLSPGASRVGCLDFRPSLQEGERELAPPAFQRIEELLQAADRLQAGDSVQEDILRLLDQGTSLGRFDRQRSPGGGCERFAFLSALSLMEWDEGDRHLWSYADIADSMRSAAGWEGTFAACGVSERDLQLVGPSFSKG